MPRPTLCLPLLLLASLSAACSEKVDGQGDDVDPWLSADEDGDGVVAADDCDDTSAEVGPDRPELCNGVDDDCDGVVDEEAEDALVWFQDADGDGFGDPEAPAEACVRPQGFADRADDCDDADPQVSPAGVEVCNGVDDDCDGEADGDGALDRRTWYPDDDGDGVGRATDSVVACEAPSGHTAAAGDCDDADATVAPGAAEVCNGIDDDCDGKPDDLDPSLDLASATTFWADADGDGHGDGAAPVVACVQPVGTATSDDDCDDGAADISPSAAEVCDGLVDEDCDGLVDDADPDVSDPSLWPTDSDGDGWGDDAAALSACVQPTGTVAAGGDCDDGDAAVHPGATEVCDGAVDEDCDGLVDDADPGLDTATASTWYADADGDGHGDASGATLACAQPSGTVTSTDDCDDTSATISPSATEVCGNGTDDDCDGTATGCTPGGSASLGVAEVKVVGEAANGRLGWSVGAGDVTGDGIDDLLMGAPNLVANGARSGGAYVVQGSVSGTVDAGLAHARVYGSAAFDGLGSAVAGGADANGDGFDDLAIGGEEGGMAWVILGPVTGTMTAASADARWTGSSGGDAGERVALHDVTGDGVADLLVGAPLDGPVSNGGAVYVVAGPVTSTGSLRSSAVELYGSSSSAQAGTGLGVGDFNSDGIGDVAMGVPNLNGGLVALYFGPVTASGSLSDWDSVVWGAASGDFGDDVSSAGDLDGDGVEDLVIGCWLCTSTGGGFRAGRAYVYAGPISGNLGTGDALARIEGATAYDYLGAAVAGAGDVDGDGGDDLVVGAPLYDAGMTNTGGAFLFYGPLTGSIAASSADATFEGEGGGVSSAGNYIGHQAGHALTGGFDANGDGYSDLLVGAPYEDTAASVAGAAYLVLGAGL